VSTRPVELFGVVVPDGEVVCVGVVRDPVAECVDGGGEALLPPPDESTIATITPPTDAAATAAASAAFFTGSEATLAPQCLHASKSS
jgi:hypothetical protein